MIADASSPGLVEAEINNLGFLFCPEENLLNDGSLNRPPKLQECPGPESKNYLTDTSNLVHAI
jgi:hypothetical protein